MKTIYKYPLYYMTVPELVRLPKGAEIIQLGYQENNEKSKSVLWALVDSDEQEEERVFMIAWTGQPIEGNVIKVYNSVQFPKGIIGTLVELKDIEGNDPKNDERLKLNQNNE